MSNVNHLAFFLIIKGFVRKVIMKIKRRIIAHRGATEFDDMENSLAAFKSAINYQIEAVELDVRISKDQILIVHHDETINNIKLHDLTYQEITLLKPEVPKFDEVLLLCKDKIFLDIEVKEAGYEKEIIKTILNHIDYHQFFCRSFYDKIITKIKKLDDKIKTGLLLGVHKASVFRRLSELFPLFRILKTKCDFVSPHYLLLKFGYITRMHLINKPVITWTLNDIKIIKKLWNKKIDGIITDIPVKAINQLK